MMNNVCQTRQISAPIQYENNKDHISKHCTSQSDELSQKETKNARMKKYL